MRKIIAVMLLMLVILISGCKQTGVNNNPEQNQNSQNDNTNQDNQNVNTGSDNQNDNQDSQNYNDTDNTGENGQTVSNENTNENENNQSGQQEIPEIDYQSVKPYEIGNIMVVMYHGIMDNEPPYQRSAEDFIKDLQYMYDHNYRLISMNDYENSYIDIPAGYTPIVLTFDDGKPSTFSLEEVNGELVCKSGTAIALLEDFCSKHPDFGKTAALFINGDNDPFKGAGTIKERLQWLVDHGYEIGNHTYSHQNLSKLSGEELQAEIGKVDQLIKSSIANGILDVITYPYGLRPSEDNRKYAQDGVYNNIPYHYSIGFREGPSGPMYPPARVGFDYFNCPRVRGYEGDEGDMWWWFDYYEKHRDYLYVSDGNPNRIAVPKDNEDKVNKEVLGDKELYLY